MAKESIKTHEKQLTSFLCRFGETRVQVLILFHLKQFNLNEGG